MSAPHILIVGNHSRDVGAWAEVLRRAGFRVGLAADVETACYALDGGRYSLLIATHGPLSRSSLDLLRRIRATPEELPCLIAMEPAAPEVAEITRLLPPGVLLDEPVTFPRLLSTVRALLCVPGQEHLGGTVPPPPAHA